MESTAYFHRIYGNVPWNPLYFHGINGKNLWHFMNFHNFLLLVYLPSTAMETLKTPSEYSVEFKCGFQGFSMANLETGEQQRLWWDCAGAQAGLCLCCLHTTKSGLLATRPIYLFLRPSQQLFSNVLTYCGLNYIAWNMKRVKIYPVRHLNNVWFRIVLIIFNLFLPS